MHSTVEWKVSWDFLPIFALSLHHYLFDFMMRSLEHKVRLNAFVIYTLVALVFIGTIAYIYSSRKDIDEQKENALQYYTYLTLTDRLIKQINETQQEANSYMITRGTKHYTQFQENLSRVDHLIDSLQTEIRDTMQLSALWEINSLLEEKGKIVLKLNQQFNLSGYLNQLNEIKNSYEAPGNRDSALVSTTIKDTVITGAVQKGFWSRLSNVFSPKKDTVITKRIVRSDTVRVLAATDSLDAVGRANELASQLETSYSNRISGIERQVRQLVNADHEISIKISQTLLELHRQIISRRIQEIRKSDQLISSSSTYSLIGGGVALALILVFIVLIIHDVNRSSSMRKVLEEANERIRQTMESRHRLLLSVSHDVKTPLNSILGLLELKKTSGRFSPEDVFSMENSGKHILSLLNNLLQFSSLEQETIRKEEHVFSLMNCCQETKKMFSPLLLKKSLAFDCRFNFPRDVHLKADELRIKQIVSNLLSNAVKYTQTGQVSFTVDYGNNTLRIRVSDTGTGIPASRLGEIFEPFSRLRQHASMAEGAGFGLYVVKGLVHLLEGEITVESEVNKGTSIEVRLPVCEAEALPVDFSPRRVLLADDDLSFLTVLQKMLSRLGHQAEIWDLSAGMEEKTGSLDSYDLLLTDMEMGVLSGIDLLRHARKHAASLPVAVMTAQQDIDENKIRELGFSAYLKKPIKMQDIQQLLGGKESLNLESLEELFDNDQQAIHEMLQIFVSSTEEHIVFLKKSLADNDFPSAGQLAHKMLPMFLQLGEEEASVLLKKIDGHRRQQLSEYPEWRDDIRLLITKSEKLIKQINTHYLNG